MAYEIESSPTNIPARRHHVTPARSEHFSTSFSSSISNLFPQYRTPHRRRNPTPTNPFALDEDRSWQGELSWQFEPTVFQENRNRGGAFSPWTANSAATPSSGGSRIFRRSANDYYLAHTRGGVNRFNDPFNENSHSIYDPLPSGRIELQSYVASTNDESFTSRKDTRPGKSPILSPIKEGSSGYRGPLAEKDDLSSSDYGVSQDIDRQIRVIKTYHDSKQPQDPRWFSVSHAYMDENVDLDHGSTPNFQETSYRVNDHLNHRLQHSSHGNDGHYDHHVGHNSNTNDHGVHSHWQSPHHMNRVDTGYGDVDRESAFEEEDDDEDETMPPKSVGLFSLFRYSTKLDFVLIMFGCLGAFINGGSLPWYSYLFGDFVNKLARGQDKDTNQMMKDVDKICLLMTGLSALVVVGAYLEITCWRMVGERSAHRIRTEYLRAVLRQDVGFFDTEISTSDIMHGISSDVAQIQEVMAEKVDNQFHPFSKSVFLQF